jgi:hypothetical protein
MIRILTATLFACLASSASASTVVLGFDGISTSSSVDVGSTFSEDGFTFTNVNSDAFGQSAQFDALAFGFGGPFLNGDTVTLTADEGTLFSVNSFDFVSFSGNLTDSVLISGLLAGALVDSVSIQSASDTFATSTGLFGSFDTLSFVGNGPAVASLILDNFVLETKIAAVPVPLSIMLLGTGLLGLGAVGRRKSKT